MEIQPPDYDQGNQAKKPEKQELSIHASVDGSLFSFAIGQVVISELWSVPSALQRLYDRMPPASHATLKWLMDTHHFSPSELYVACKLGALVAPNGQLRQAKTAWFDYGCGAFFLVPSVALLLLFFAAMLATVGTQVPLVDRLPIIGAITITMLTIYATVALYVWPNVTARKVVRALLQERQT